MKKLFLIAVAALFATTSFAQTTASDKVLKVNLGFGSSIGGLPIGVSYEQGIHAFGNDSFLTLGGHLGYESNSVTNKWKRSTLSIMAQCNYYFLPLVDKMDFYAGLRLGYANISSSVYDGKGYVKENWGSPLCHSIHIGASYWVANDLAINAELGHGISYLNLGIAYKF